MGLLIQMLPSALAAALVSAAILFSARWWSEAARSTAPAISLGAGYAAGHAIAAGLPAVLPANTTQWLFAFALSAAVIALVLEFVRPNRVLRIAIWSVVFAVVARLLLQPRYRYAWKGGEAWIAAAVMVVVAVFVAWCLSSRRERHLELPLVGAILAAATSATLTLSGSLLLGQLAFVLAASTATAFLFGWRRFSFAQGFAAVCFLLLASLWLSGYFYAELPAVSVALLVIASAAAWLMTPITPGEWKALLLRAVIVALPAAAAVVVAFRASPSLDY
jgi:hypothetical protein